MMFVIFCKTDDGYFSGHYREPVQDVCNIPDCYKFGEFMDADEFVECALGDDHEEYEVVDI